MREALSIYPFHILIPPSYFDNLYSTFNLQCLFLKMKLQGGRGKKEGGEKESYYREKRWLFSGTISSP